MKKLGFLFFFVLPLAMFAVNPFEIHHTLVHYRSLRLEAEMAELINLLEGMPQEGYILALLCEALYEYATWAKITDNERLKLYEKAVSVGKKAAEMLPGSSYANCVAGIAIGKLVQYKGVLQSLFMLPDFDKYILRAIELDPTNYLALVAMGVRLRDAPWPFRDLKKAEEYFLKATEIEPAYLDGYYELALLYEEMSKTVKDDEQRKDHLQKAKELYKKILQLTPHPQWIEQGNEIKQKAFRKLEELSN